MPASPVNGYNETAAGVSIYELIDGLYQEIKYLAVSNCDQLFDGKRTNELFINNAFIKDIKSNSKISMLDILRQHGLEVLETGNNATAYHHNIESADATCVAHFVEIRMHLATRQLKINKVITVINAGKIEDIKTIGSQLHQALHLHLAGLMSGRLSANVLPSNIHHDFVTTDFSGSIPAIEIIFVKPDGSSDQGCVTDATALETICLKGLSNALKKRHLPRHRKTCTITR